MNLAIQSYEAMKEESETVHGDTRTLMNITSASVIDTKTIRSKWDTLKTPNLPYTSEQVQFINRTSFDISP